MTPQELAIQYQANDFDYFMNRALERVPENIDTREGSIIYDALAPAAYLMAEMSLNLADTVLNSFTQTATGEYLDYRAEERGLIRESATYAEILVTITDENGNPLVVTVGDRFSSIGVIPIYYVVTEISSVNGMATLIAETEGEMGNSYIGQLLPVSAIPGFGNAEITEITIPARDKESDEVLRSRLLVANEIVSFGGNVSDYINYIREIVDVSVVQIFPTWNGGGTVKAVILNNQYLAPSQALIDKVQMLVDPKPNSGNGYGIAPIGHNVTVVGPQLRTINVTLSVDTLPSVTIEDVRHQVEQVVSDYFSTVRESWGNINTDNRTYTVTLYRSQVIVSLLKINGITNATDVKFDGVGADVTVTTSSVKSELPVVGTVIINE